MKNKQLLIICAVILIAACIIGFGVYFGLSNQNTGNVTQVNNTTNVTNSSNLTVDKLANNSDNQNAASSSSGSGGDDYVYSPQRDGYVKTSGQYDKDSQGRTVYSYQGSDGVIYERYYDSSGREMSSEEYYR